MNAFVNFKQKEIRKICKTIKDRINQDRIGFSDILGRVASGNNDRQQLQEREHDNENNSDSDQEHQDLAM
jgi:hypothetical protein